MIHENLPNSESPEIAKGLEQALLAHVRHELRNPLNTIIGYSELILEDLEDSQNLETVADITKILTNARQLLKIINNILNPALVENSLIKLDWETLGREIRYQVRTPINNIIGYSEIVLEDAEPQWVPDLQKIHLSASHLTELIEDLVSLASASATPDIKLNILQPESLMVESLINSLTSNNKAQSNSFAPSNCCILIVDDNPDNREILARQLKHQGYNTEVAQNGSEALELLKQKSFDLVLLDILMPDTNGYQLLSIIKQDPNFTEIPVIMLSALDNLESVVSCIKIGANDYLSKPYDPILLKARINACLEKKILRDQELEYLRQVKKITLAASALETASFIPESLTDVAERPDALGKLAKVFISMAASVYKREQQLKQQVLSLRIEIDQTKKEKQVQDITNTEYFQDLRKKAGELRSLYRENNL